MNKLFKYISPCIFFGLFISIPASATIIGGSVTGGSAMTAGGIFVKLSVPLSNPYGTPNSVGDDTFQSPNLYGFDEYQNDYIASPLTPDVGSTIAADQYVASHYVFFDPGPTQRIVGTVNFDSPVLGIFTSTSTLAATDFLANTGVNYLSPNLRGLEANTDSVSFVGQQISLDFTASTPGDYIRVLTAYSPGGAKPLPEPTTFALFGLGLAGLSFLRRRKAS